MRKDKLIVDGKEYPVFIQQEERMNTHAFIGMTGFNIRIPMNTEK